jgi:hypothetical protein
MMTPNLNSPEKVQLLEELEKEINQHKQLSKIKSVFTQFLFWISILASILASTLAAIKYSWAGVSILAAIPTLVIIINNSFKYSAQARWHKRKEKKFLGLRNQLKYEGQAVEEVSKGLAKLEEEMEDLRVEMELPRSK